MADILQAKRKDLEQRMRKTPLDAVRALASMQGRPIPFLDTITANAPPMLIGQIRYVPPSHHGENDDPVAQAVHFARAGIDVIALFTDADIYSGGLDDLMFVVRAVQPFQIPVISQDYIFDEYQVVEARAAGASGLVLDSGLIDPALLRTLVSSTQRNRMTAIVRVTDETTLDVAVALSPQVVALALPPPRTPADLLHLRHLRQRVPAHIRVALDTPATTAAELALATQTGVHALFVPEPMIQPARLGTLRRRLGSARY